MFIFGATTYEELINNDSLIIEPFKTTTLMSIYIAPFFHLFEKDTHGYLNWLCVKRKPFRKALRMSSVRDDIDGDSCKICFQRQSCILLQPCNHLGLCNICSYKTFRIRFFNNKEITKRIQNNFIRCPFCSSFVSHISYIFKP